jgi:hypothetical protein
MQKACGVRGSVSFPKGESPHNYIHRISILLLGPWKPLVRNACEGPQIQVNRKVGRFVVDVLEYGKKVSCAELLEGKSSQRQIFPKIYLFCLSLPLTVLDTACHESVVWAIW